MTTGFVTMPDRFNPMTLLADAIDDDSTRQALSELRSARRKNRVEKVDAFDAFYKAYIVAIGSAAGIYAAAGAFGDKLLTASEQHSVRLDGPAWLGLLVAFVVAIGLRSGGRGGPLAFERSDVRHVLLAPVDRRYSIRRPALRQLRYSMFLGLCFGAAAGAVAMRRMPDKPVEWVASGALFGLATIVLSYGAAMVAGGYRLRSWMADLVAVVMLGWSVADIKFGIETSPSTFIGQVAVWPLKFQPTAFIGVAVAVLVAAWGIGVVNRSSIEAAERRSRLVGQLRFAATLQDVRTVMVLQRQLAQEHLRQHPWIRLRPAKYAGVKRGRIQRRVFYRRGIEGMLRWPMLRLTRLLVFTAIASASVAGVWAGTGPLIVVAGLAMWMAALDLCEPLAQEIDHPDRTKAMAGSIGLVLINHVVVPFFMLLVLVTIGSIPFFVFGNADIVTRLLPLFVLIAGTALGGASLTINAQPPAAASMVDTAETASIKFIWRVLVPPAIAVVGFVPLIASHNWWVKSHHDLTSMVAHSNGAVAIGITLAAISLLWLRYADDFRTTMAMSAKTAPKSVAKPDAVEAKKNEDDAKPAPKPGQSKTPKGANQAKKSNKKKGRK